MRRSGPETYLLWPFQTNPRGAPWKTCLGRRPADPRRPFKLTNSAGFAASLEKRGVPLADVFAPLGAAVEFCAGVAVLIGFQTRVAAVLMVLFTVAATFIAHRFWEFDGAARQTQQSAFFKNLAIVGGYLVLMVSGGGRFSIDGWWRGWRGGERRVAERREASWSRS
jgi:putative oxidoreductase